MNVFDECLSFCLEGRTDGSFLPVNAVRAVWSLEVGGRGRKMGGTGRGSEGRFFIFIFSRFFWVLPFFLGWLEWVATGYQHSSK